MRQLSRRNLFRAASLLAAGGGAAHGRTRFAAKADSISRGDAAMMLRQDAASEQHDQPFAPQVSNGDEAAFPRYSTAFTKGLPHDQNGEVDGAAYETLLQAISSGKHADFERISRGSGRRFVSPQAAYAFHLEGGDSHRFACPPVPSFSTPTAAAEMVELYWQSLCRDVPFAEYSTSTVIRQAAGDLAATPATVFRGPTPGDQSGPYISQFLAKPIPCNSGLIDQRFRTPQPGIDFVTIYGEWLQIQTGVPPWREYIFDSSPRYIRSGRDLAEWVHYDFFYQAFLNAALILLNAAPETVLYDNRVVLAKTNPYRESKVQDGFVTFGFAEVIDWLGRVTTAAMKAAWAQKWLVHRRLRPEEFGGRVHQTRVKAIEYPIHTYLLNSPAVETVYQQTGSYLLPQAFPEGCPLHPAYPSGHATVSGACAVVLKAFFDESALIPNCVHAAPDGLSLMPCPESFVPTVGSEVNKLAFNVAMGRDWAGIHYRSDAVEGLRLGENVAISVLQDLVQTYSEDFDGFSFTRFDGTPVKINRNGE